jgi:hypothetical protein
MVGPNKPIAIRGALVLEANGGWQFVGDCSECGDGYLKANHVGDMVASPRKTPAPRSNQHAGLRAQLQGDQSCRVGCYAQAIVLFVAMVRNASR